MEIKQVKHSYLNQNGYNKNSLTKERIGTLFIYPIDFTPDDCLSFSNTISFTNKFTF